MGTHTNPPGASKPTIALLGNPNCGKTTLFNALTGSRQQVGNWSGVTVERKVGYFFAHQEEFEIIDLPGTYTLCQIPSDGPQDEIITSNFLKTQAFSLVLNVVDAINLERNLYLTLECLEQGLPVIMALNRMDLAKKQGIGIAIKQLGSYLGCQVLPITARQGMGLAELKTALGRKASPTALKIPYSPIIEQQLQGLSEIYRQLMGEEAPRYQLVRWLEGEGVACALPMAKSVMQAQQTIFKETGQNADVLIASARYAFIERIVQQVSTQSPVLTPASPTVFSLDKITCHRYLGFPFFLGVMYALFFFAINIGGVFQDFFEILSHAIFVEGMSSFLNYFHSPAWVIALLANGLGNGISTVMTFIPVLGAMFFALAFLEDCGYMARAAFVMDRLMRALGLPGKSFVPMIVGFGCNVPAIMGARTLDNKRDRILAVMMSPFMSCGARLAIFTVFVAAFFPQGGQNIVFLLYLIGILMAVLTGLLLKKTLLKGEAAPLLLEMPDYQWPHWQSLRAHCWHRLRRFVLNAGKLILPVCVVLGGLNHVSFDGKWLNQPSKDSVLAVVGQKMVPLFAPLGMEKENWPAAVGLFTGVLAKEVVIGTLNALYEEPDPAQASISVEFSQRFKEAGQSMIDNAKALSVAWINPIAAKAPEVELAHRAYGKMVECFSGQANAFAYLLFVLLYFPCISATAAMVREVQKGWTVFSICWTTGLAYAIAVVYYQCATFTDHPYRSLAWITAWILIALVGFCGIRLYSQRLPRIVPTPIILST